RPTWSRSTSVRNSSAISGTTTGSSSNSSTLSERGFAVLNRLNHLPTMFPKSTLIGLLIVTVFAAAAMTGLRWETDARVYFPKGHPAIQYDELVADTFHVKDSIIIAIVNEDGIFNPE